MANNSRERILIFATLAVVGLFLTDQFVIEPLIASWKARSEAIAQLETKINKGQALIDRRDSLNRRWEDMQKRGLPANHASAESKVLASVARWAQAGGITVTDLKPDWTEDEDLGRELLEVRVSATGNMARIARFLYELENDPLALKLEDAQLSARDDKGVDLTLEARFTGLELQEKKS